MIHIEPTVYYITDNTERRILIIGDRGSGKSASANTIIGEKKFESRVSDKSVTTTPHFHMTDYKDKRYLIVDTPTWFEFKPAMKALARTIAIIYPGFHAMIVAVKIGHSATDETLAIHYLEKLFGIDVFKRIIVLFTGIDNLEEGESIDDYVKDHILPERQGILSKCDHRYVGVNNRAPESAREIIFQKIEDVYERQKGKCHDTISAAQKKYFESEKKRRHRIAPNESDIMLQIRTTISRHDECTEPMITQLRKELSTKIEKSKKAEGCCWLL